MLSARRWDGSASAPNPLADQASQRDHRAWSDALGSGHDFGVHTYEHALAIVLDAIDDGAGRAAWTGASDTSECARLVRAHVAAIGDDVRAHAARMNARDVDGHAAVLSRTELLNTEAFVTELSELVLRYLQPVRDSARKPRKASAS